VQDSDVVLSLPRPVEGVRRKGVRWKAVTLLVTSVVVFYLVLGPLFIALIATFREKDTLPLEAGPFTFVNYARVFLDPATWTLMVNTLVFAGGSLIIGMGLAIVFSWLIERSDLPYHELMFSLIIAPMAMPGMMAAIAWIFLLDPRIGLINLILRGTLGLDIMKGPLNIYTLWGMIFVEGIRMVPTIFLMISGSFRSMDPSLEEASRVAGKSNWVTTIRITLPLMWPAIMAALLYYLIVAMEVFEVPGVLGLTAGIHVFSTRIYWAVNPSIGGLPDYGLASTLGLLLIAISVVLIWLYYRTTKKTYRFVTVTGKGFRPQRVRLGRWKYAARLLCAFYFAVALALPLFILLWTSLHKFYLPPSWAGLMNMTVDSYLELVRYPAVWKALINTILLALLTGTATMAISFFCGMVFGAESFRANSNPRHSLFFTPRLAYNCIGACGYVALPFFPQPFLRYHRHHFNCPDYSVLSLWLAHHGGRYSSDTSRAGGGFTSRWCQLVEDLWIHRPAIGSTCLHQWLDMGCHSCCQGTIRGSDAFYPLECRHLNKGMGNVGGR